MLLPVANGSSKSLSWKIWILNTRLDSLDIQSEDEDLLKSPAKDFGSKDDFETDVFIIGGGNA